MTGLVEGLSHLVEDADLYLDLLKLEEGQVHIAVELTDSRETATIVLGETIRLVEGAEEPDLLLSMQMHVFDEVLRGEADFGALIGRSKMSDVRPINFKILNPNRTAAISEALKMMVFLFTPGRVKVKELREELAGEAHGARPIPLVYWDGVRFAWYVVKEGEVLNEAGERDPYPQAFVILRGRGSFILDDVEIELRPKTVIYVPCNSVHQIRAEENVEAIWLAWQTPSM